MEAAVDVGAWHRNLGLGQYEAAFRENEIDAEVLPDLTDADFEKLGVLMGHRKRLLKAITGLSSAGRERAPGQAVAKIEPKPYDAAERRQFHAAVADVGRTCSPRSPLAGFDVRAELLDVNLAGSPDRRRAASRRASKVGQLKRQGIFFRSSGCDGQGARRGSSKNNQHGVLDGGA